MRSALLNLSLAPNLRQAERSLQAGWVNPVIPGDHPDPSIVRIGHEFWASATSGEWSPQFPLFRSNDLTHWIPAGAVFFDQPDWAEGSFWAPELVTDRERFFVYYVARKRDGPLCVAVASADQPAGPYVDHGPIICQELGSIDPCFARDEHGQPFLIWKEDGNSRDLSTPIWAQPLQPDLIRLTGTKTMLITNDRPWEEGVVEGPYVLRHAHRFYLFYAGNSCCGRECKYAEGVARATHLLGPWEKFPRNPLIGANDQWRCPGHGTAVHGDPRHDYLLYHAYPVQGSVYVGREALLDEIRWTEDDWPEVNGGRGPHRGAGAEETAVRPAPPIDFADDFTSDLLGPSWQWPVNTHPDAFTGTGSLTLGIPAPSTATRVHSAMIAVPRPPSILFEASVTIVKMHLATAGSVLWGGLAIVGDPFNTVGLGVANGLLVLTHRAGSYQERRWQITVPTLPLSLRVTTVDALYKFQFAWRTTEETWTNAGEIYDASDLPAWDRGLRIGLMLEGDPGCRAIFSDFLLEARDDLAMDNLAR